MSSQQQNKVCKGCHCTREGWEFLNEKGAVLKKCYTNEFYEGENTELSMSFDIELSTLVNVILENNGGENIENVNCEIGRYIVSLISE
ncbi:hypothetical protein C1646_769487, partial [Rhizophagus diaphanus]